MASRLVLGLTGPNAAGKGEVAHIIQALGFSYLSLSDMVRREAARRDLEPTRDNLIRIGRELRREHGPGVLGERAREVIEPPCVVDSIRNPGEVAELRRLSGFYLIGVRAPADLRFRRLRERGRAGDPETLEEFEEKERIENSRDAEGQRLDATLALADRVVTNAGSLEALERKVTDLIRDLKAAEDEAGTSTSDGVES